MKHQSAWDALILPVVLGDFAPVVKRELLLLPFYGWYAARAGAIAIDRNAGAGAVRRMIAAVRQIASSGRRSSSFRKERGRAWGTPSLSARVAALYQALSLPVVPARSIPAFLGDAEVLSNGRAKSSLNSRADTARPARLQLMANSSSGSRPPRQRSYARKIP